MAGFATRFYPLRLAGLAVGIVAFHGATPSFAESEAAFPMSGPGWNLTMTTYGWLPWLTGDSTVRGRSFDVEASPDDVLDALDWSQIPVWMSYTELRNGKFILFNDIVYAKMAGSVGFERSHEGPILSATLRGQIDVDYEQAVIELGGGYEVWSNGSKNATGYTTVDVLAGGRYWYQELDLSVALSASVALNGPLGIVDLTRSGSRVIAKSGSVDWIDPFIGARFNYVVAPGQSVAVRGDIGGFGAGSDFSWHALAAYNMNLCLTDGYAIDGYLGYKALSVDYSEGSGNRKYEYDVIQHGPVMGLTVHF